MIRLRHTLALDHGPARMDADAVIQYATAAHDETPRFPDLGPDYEPNSPAWIATLVPTTAGGIGAPVLFMPLWARVYCLTSDARVRREREQRIAAEAAKEAAREQERRAEEEEGRQAEIAADAHLSDLWHEAGMTDPWPGIMGAGFRECQRMVTYGEIRTAARTHRGLREALLWWAGVEATTEIVSGRREMACSAGEEASAMGAPGE